MVTVTLSNGAGAPGECSGRNSGLPGREPYEPSRKLISVTADLTPEQRCVAEYLSLMDCYLDGRIGAKAFQQSYWPLRRRWMDVGVEPPYEERGSLDSDVDAFAFDPNDVAWHEIDEPTLRARVEEAANRLRQWLNASAPET